jgi:hypothetical protein
VASFLKGQRMRDKLMDVLERSNDCVGKEKNGGEGKTRNGRG